MDKDFKRKDRTVNHSMEWVKASDVEVHTNTIESAFSLLKRTDRFLSSREHKAPASLPYGI
jgi:hypothetical protein